jgi:biopolymer transport protein ExbB/TolQ
MGDVVADRAFCHSSRDHARARLLLLFDARQRRCDSQGPARLLTSQRLGRRTQTHAELALVRSRDRAAAATERIQGEEKISRLRMERNLAFLGTVGNNAPFVGLLGTVIGIIRSFHSLDQSQGKVTSGLMMDIGEALVATAIGIMVALPAVAAYNFFQRVIKARLSRGGALGSDVVSHLLSTRHQEQAAVAAE